MINTFITPVEYVAGFSSPPGCSVRGSYGASYFSGSGFVGDQRRATRFGRRSWAEHMARALKRYDMRVVRVRRVFP